MTRKEDLLKSLEAEYLNTMGWSQKNFGKFLKEIGQYLLEEGIRIEIQGQDKIEKSKGLKQTRHQNKTNSPAHTQEENGSVVVQRVKPTVLVLFIKADSANMLIDAIMKKGSLYVGAEKELFVSAMKMWVGTDSQYSNSNVKMEFSRATSLDSFVKEYDYVAMRFKLDKEYSGYETHADSYDRNQFFLNVCKDNIQLVEYSGRLSFDDNITTDAYDVF